MSLEQLNAKLRYLRDRQRDASGALAKAFGKEIASAEAARERRFSVVARRG